MSNGKTPNYMTSFSIVGAIILLIGLFTPAGINIQDGALGLSILPGFFIMNMHYSNYTYPPVLPQFLALVNAIFLTLLILICGLKVISSSLKLKRGKIDFQLYRQISLNNAFILILSAVFWLVLVSFSFFLYGLNYWELFMVSFGIIAPFITAILIIIEFFINRSKVTREKRKGRSFFLWFSSLGAFIIMTYSWYLFMPAGGTIATVLITLYLLITTLITFIGIFSTYNNPKRGSNILIAALILGIFNLTLLSTIILARKQHQEQLEQSSSADLNEST
ncbi:MAG: hypothetical protein ACTSP9_04875 [Promethearchaeota archaeon]